MLKMTTTERIHTLLPQQKGGDKFNAIRYLQQCSTRSCRPPDTVYGV
ncbi:hypothetical protein SCTVLC_0881 [Serratia symbiotica SCt-VLC]|uniref:Uncharacterized protein n=1 Tax=Serratia symbiotica SCt-VLC TaxID=1347341 RepID=A0A068RB26_9GAMM|nr:hypothetical protein SCTVLC_0881 [Serratia symbiotica SCt-VLC]